MDASPATAHSNALSHRDFRRFLGAAFLASLGPAESAVRGSLVEALEYE